MKSKKGFTLIELLVVIAIIGILTSIILASLSTAKARGRDARRAADIKQLQQAAENYFEDYAKYPTDLSSLSPTFLTSTPVDPLGVSYGYAVNTPPVAYCIGTKFENGTPNGLGATTNCSFSNGAFLNDPNNYNFVIQGP